MEEKKDYLNEENYQKTKKGIIKVSVIVLIVSLVLGGGLIAGGFLATNISKKNADKINQERYQNAYKQSEKNVAAAKDRLKEIATEKEKLTKQYNVKEQECDSLDQSDPNWLAKVRQCRRESSAIDDKIDALESEEFKISNGNYTVFYDIAESKDYRYLAIVGGVIALLGAIASLVLYIIAKKREIKAFSVQQEMPIKQEAIKEMAPTVGEAAKEVVDKVTENTKTKEDNSEVI